MFDESSQESEDEHPVAKRKPQAVTNTVPKDAQSARSRSSFGESDQDKERDDESMSSQPKPVETNKPLDFAAELARKIAAKSGDRENKPVNENSTSKSTPVKQPDVAEQTSNKTPPARKSIVASNLFDPSDNDSDEDLFAPKKSSSNLLSKKKSLFDDSGSDREEDQKEPAKSKPTPDKTTPQAKPVNSDLFEDKEDDDVEPEEPPVVVKKATPKSKLNDELSKVLASKNKNLNISDSDSEDRKLATSVSQIKITEEKPQPTSVTKPAAGEQPKKKLLIFEDEDDDNDLFSIVSKKTAPSSSQPQTAKVEPVKTTPAVAPPTKKLTIFDDEDDEDPLFNNFKSKSTIPEVVKPVQSLSGAKNNASSSKLASIFDDDNDDDDLFKTNKSATEAKLPLPQASSSGTSLIKTNEPVVEATVKPAVTNIFDDDSDTDNNLFNSNKNLNIKPAEKPTEKVEPKVDMKPVEPVKVVQEPKKRPSLFDDESDLFSSVNASKIKEPLVEKPEEPVKPAETTEAKAGKTNLFDKDDSDDDFFGTKKPDNQKVVPTSSVVNEDKKLEPPKLVGKSLFDSDDEDDIFKTSVTKNTEPAPAKTNITITKAAVEIEKPTPPSKITKYLNFVTKLN